MNDVKMFQISTTDFDDLERFIPDIADKLMIHLQPRQKTQLRRIKEILSNVRWNYGPPDHVEVIDG